MICGAAAASVFALWAVLLLGPLQENDFQAQKD
jgi:hypothetical protein